ncbi:hypothetical protein ILUMI_25077 [Ignelater luminosus]|uniref:PiggyBac transposable element-derived protein domain-containing protein n=1 Tax=Ignelater luminosus TaxID=2038154 RepID=A0A8K0CCC1_IGNLU|nr:hypothetical protein ILUMI_25077 [Ignelater luminosus]
MDKRERQLLQWLEEVSDCEQDVTGSDSEKEFVGETAEQSEHDSESEIEYDVSLPQINNENVFEDHHEVIELLVTCTNLYSENVQKKFQRERDANPTNVVEVKAFLGLLVMAGVLKASHLNFLDLWAHDGSGVDMFRLTMSYKRFLFLLRCLRFDNVLDRPDKQKTDNSAAELLIPEYKLTLLGTLNKRKPDIPLEFLPNQNRPQFSSLFGFHDQITLVSYVPKPKTAVVLLSTMHNDVAIDTSTNETQKPEITIHYNDTKEGVDCNDQLCATYNVGRRTKR